MLAVLVYSAWLEKFFFLVLFLVPVVFDQLLRLSFHLLIFAERTDSIQQLFMELFSGKSAEEGRERDLAGR